MSVALATIAAEIGAPIIRDILSRKIGAGNAQLAEEVVGAVARRVGVPVDKLEQVAVDQRPVVIDAIREVERSSPELIALYTAGLDYQLAALQAEQDEPLWARAWRPLGMYGLGVLWFWQLIGLHVANAIWRIALPPADMSVLMQLSGLYMALYMGGHTLKSVTAGQAGGKS